MTTTPENVRTWRDLADQLTPAQLAALEREERVGASSPYRDGALRYEARRYVVGNIGTAMVGAIAEPSDSTGCLDWDTDWCEDGSWSRYFYGTERKAAGTTIRITGRQYEDGRTEREVLVEGGIDNALSVDEAKQLAAALLCAAEEVERLSNH
ncbi:hypothetical protein [Mycolicibacterium litorale]|uniref:Uncharacterized protein n=1 Tax=Mycolicibacterium litorale TaxID=758802 RepID=A0AAD1IIZ5_9MYCO|nr:hypothetical protein [Mycolicibacterium litorale]MCV7418822.1 hypothetical protein [Mycolicibacterium litorale]TDY00396.1 hypothetical protein BCL50_5253 [Mycolicibacterium litorale]BBY15771.1 hypothetical protein MLIT_13630 [Mycolicibacterium litorale]